MELKGYRRERGLLWPDYDERCAEVTFDEIDGILSLATNHTKNHGVVIQAGGNCGQLVRLLAKRFSIVYTFEPDHRNFIALSVNTSDLPNVYRLQSALGSDTERGTFRGMENGDTKYPQNCGALFMSGAGSIPTLTIDDLGLADCDLILLDVEGSELSALEGAKGTIERLKPTIIIEEKGLGEKFFADRCKASDYVLSTHNYKSSLKFKNDLVLNYE